MTKIDELISSVAYVAFEEFGENRVVSIEDVSDIMKIYAEWYAQKLISLIEDETWIDDFGEFIITQTEIQKINLPEHD